MTTQKPKLWVTVELSYLGEKQLPEDLYTVLRKYIEDDLDVFIPAVSYQRKDNSMVICLMEGYAFIEGGRPAGYYLELESSPYIKRVLTRDESSGRYLEYVQDKDIEVLRHNLEVQTIRTFETGDEVEVVEGSFKNLEGTILEVQDEKALVKIHDLVSIKTIVELPLQFLMRKS